MVSTHLKNITRIGSFPTNWYITAIHTATPLKMNECPLNRCHVEKKMACLPSICFFHGRPVSFSGEYLSRNKYIEGFLMRDSCSVLPNLRIFTSIPHCWLQSNTATQGMRWGIKHCRELNKPELDHISEVAGIRRCQSINYRHTKNTRFYSYKRPSVVSKC